MQPNWNKGYNNNNRYQGHTQNYQQFNTQPNPQRFAVFNLIPDESGFTLPNYNYVFYFDENGGWYDEFNNYYNSDGQPDTPPRFNNNRRQDNRHDYEDDYDPADDFANEYEQDDDDGDDEHMGHYDNIYLNIENKKTLAKCLKDEEVEIEIRNMDYRTNEDQFEKFLVGKTISWVEFEFEYDDRDRFRGICYMTCDKTNAEKFIEFNGNKVLGREIKINVSRKKENEGDDDEHENEEDIDVHAIGVGDEPIVINKTEGTQEEQKTEEKKN